MTRIALYARNSKPPKGWKPEFPGQEPPGSWKQQLEQLRAWAKKEGHDVVAECHDANVSGKDGNRPGWQKVMSLVRGHHVQLVAAVKLDRVMRSNIHFYETVREFQVAHCQLTFTEQGVTLGDKNPLTKALVGFLSLMAELERDWAFDRQAAVMTIGNDGRIYGPRSDQPAGRPTEYGPEHKFRTRGDGRVEHQKDRCAACKRGETPGPAVQEEDAIPTGG